MSKNDDYEPGNPEYDYWNDKNLYPDLRNEYDDYNTHSQLNQRSDLDGSRIGFGSVFLAIFIWLLLFAPFAFFLTWEDWIVQVIFWGGVIITTILFIISIYNAAQAERKKK